MILFGYSKCKVKHSSPIPSFSSTVDSSANPIIQNHRLRLKNSDYINRYFARLLTDPLFFSLTPLLVLQILFCITSNSTLLNPKESSSSTLPIRTLEEILQNRIIQKKREMHPSHNKAYLECLRIEIETIQWVLAQILTLLRQSSSTAKS